MKTYIYKAIDSSTVRGYNRTIEVYRIKNNKPDFVGVNDRMQSAAWRGYIDNAYKLILEKTGDKNGKNIQLFEV